jgi:hypothetical protein
MEVRLPCYLGAEHAGDESEVEGHNEKRREDAGRGPARVEDAKGAVIPNRSRCSIVFEGQQFKQGITGFSNLCVYLEEMSLIVCNLHNIPLFHHQQ